MGSFKVKTLLRWLILGAVLFFLLTTLKQHGQEVAHLRITPGGYGYLGMALGITLAAHSFAGMSWAWTLQVLQQPVPATWGIRVYLKTNIAKYLPGNVWHFYGRIHAATHRGIAADIGILSVLLESLLMVAAAGILPIAALPQHLGLWQIALPICILMGIQPRLLNPVLQKAHQLKQSSIAQWERRSAPGSTADATAVPRSDRSSVWKSVQQPVEQSVQQSAEQSAEQSMQQSTSLNLNAGPTPDRANALRIQHYPLVPLLGELGFLGLRTIGFILTFLPLTPLSWNDLPPLVNAFSWAWLLGFIIPGLPGGVGVFETIVLVLLPTQFPQGITLAAVALYRLINTIAEGLGAGLVHLNELGLKKSR